MGSTGDPSGGPGLAPYGAVTSSRKRGAAREDRSSDARHRPGSVRCVPRALSVTVPAGGVVDRCRRRGSDGAGLLAALNPPGQRPRTKDEAVPHLRRPLVARSCLAWHHHPWTAAGGPVVGAGPPAASSLRTSTPPGQGQVSATDRPASNPRVAAVHAIGCVGLSASTSPRPRLAKRARGAIPEPQHRLAGGQRDLPEPRGAVLRSLHVDKPPHPAQVRPTSEVRRSVSR